MSRPAFSPGFDEDLPARPSDPLTGCEPDAEYKELFTRIVNAVPAPIGLGAAA
jgi:hypothetical protein